MSNFLVNGIVDSIESKAKGVSSSGKEWEKQDFVIQTKGNYPVKICFSLFGDKISNLDNVTEGCEVDVSFSVESREYNGKWYHNVNASKVTILSNGGTKKDNGLIETKSIKQGITEKNANKATELEEDELPF